MLTRLSRFSVPIFIVILNLALVLAWGGSVWLKTVNFPYLAPLIGFLALMAPAFNLAMTFEQLSERVTDKLIFILWVALFTIVLTPFVVAALSLGVIQQFPIQGILWPFILWWAISFFIVIIVSSIKKQPTVFHQLPLPSSYKRELGFVGLGFLLILVINFVLYPLIPEADGYLLLIKWRLIQVDPALFGEETRALFLTFVNLCSQVMAVDLYWIFKAVIPLLHVTLVLSGYWMARRYVQSSWLRILVALAPFFFPVVLQESLIARPQSLFLIALLPSVVITIDVLQNKQKTRPVYWLLALFVISVLGMKAHTLFALIVLVALISMPLFLRSVMVSQPLDAFVTGLGILVLLYPVIVGTRIIPDTWEIVNLFIQAIQRGNFEWWFIDHYRNVDGLEVGWPGLTWLFYYGYNLGLFFPVIGLLFLLTQRTKRIRGMLCEVYWALFFLLGFFFFIAEVGPRIGLAYLPDRAWLFFSLLGTLLMPAMVQSIAERMQAKRLVYGLGVMALLAVAAGSALTFAKQGWVTTEEVKAAEFVRTSMPPDAIVLGPGSMRIMARYYGQRTYDHPPSSIFLSGEKQALEGYLRQEELAYQAAVDAVPKNRKNLSYRLYEVAGQVVRPELSEEQLTQYLDNLSILSHQDFYRVDEAKLRELYPTRNRPVYLVYNERKFNSLYGGRDWWRVSNFYGTDVKKLSQIYPVVYQQEGITIWEARK